MFSISELVFFHSLRIENKSQKATEETLIFLGSASTQPCPALPPATLWSFIVPRESSVGQELPLQAWGVEGRTLFGCLQNQIPVVVLFRGGSLKGKVSSLQPPPRSSFAYIWIWGSAVSQVSPRVTFSEISLSVTPWSQGTAMEKHFFLLVIKLLSMGLSIKSLGVWHKRKDVPALRSSFRIHLQKHPRPPMRK